MGYTFLIVIPFFSMGNGKKNKEVHPDTLKSFAPKPQPISFNKCLPIPDT